MAERDDDLDPDTLARLAAWFGAPAPRAPHRPRASAGPRDVAELAADPELLGRLEAHRDRADALSRARPLPPGAADPTIAAFDEEAWNLRLAGEPREVDRPDDIPDALRHRTPQALLRDLHRPVRPVPPVKLRARDPGVGAGHRAREIVQGAMRARYRVRVREEPSPRAIAAEEMASLRALLAAPWQRAIPDRSAGEASLEPGPEDAIWFGELGGYDPDL